MYATLYLINNKNFQSCSKKIRNKKGMTVIHFSIYKQNINLILIFLILNFRIVSEKIYFMILILIYSRLRNDKYF